ncbi:spermatogenesis associated 6-like protein [Oppia nitens]|uniref:spermatogenesis associated 6-like protein n=1 Tax=Oppia nitens TaxID=1686743 RepID=UPI0023DBC973|nr:spermatogenesis associated 6-like protein [Oppia nitens]
MRLLVDIRIRMISCPGVRMSYNNSSDIGLHIKLFNSLAISSQSKLKFPIFLYEHFFFSKDFNCDNKSQLLDLLSEETICIELLDENGLTVCRYESNSKDFLYPCHQLRPQYSQSSRSLLMDCCLLPIAPKLEFNIINTILNDIQELEPQFTSSNDCQSFESIESSDYR